MGDEKWQIEVGEALRRATEDRPESMTVLVNMIADRYMGMIERVGRVPTLDLHTELYRRVVDSFGRPLTSQEIARFADLCEDYLRRNPDFPQEPGKTALMILRNCSFAELVYLVDRYEHRIGATPQR